MTYDKRTYIIYTETLKRQKTQRNIKKICKYIDSQLDQRKAAAGRKSMKIQAIVSGKGEYQQLEMIVSHIMCSRKFRYNEIPRVHHNGWGIKP